MAKNHDRENGSELGEEPAIDWQETIQKALPHVEAVALAWLAKEQARLTAEESAFKTRASTTQELGGREIAKEETLAKGREITIRWLGGGLLAVMIAGAATGKVEISDALAFLSAPTVLLLNGWHNRRDTAGTAPTEQK